MDLNSNQLEAVNAGEGVWQVLAGPGSGKTQVLTSRYKRLSLAGHRPLCLTFTRKAAEEMSVRAMGGNFRTISSLAYLIAYRASKPALYPENFDLSLLVPRAIERLKKEPGKYKYDFVMIDEAQDCSQEDWDFVKLLSNNIFAVGDFLQCLYGFRGSKPELFLDMKSNFPEAQTLFLGKNYRSTKNIVNFCKKIAPIRGEFLDQLCSDNEEGAPVQILNYPNNIEEAEAVISTAFVHQGGSAVLARTNYQLEVFRKLGAPSTLELSTIHAAKGKEWDNVFVIGCQQGLLPFKNGDQDEEARILFVAASRAKKRLWLTSWGTNSRLLEGPGQILWDGRIL